MRTVVKLYIAFVGLAAIVLLVHDLSELALWPHPWSLGVTIALIVLTAIGEQLQFELRRGWYTDASAVAHVAAAFLLPPGLAIAIASLGAIVRGFRYPLPLAKAGFNLASITLSVCVAALLATFVGGPERVSPGGDWFDTLDAILVSATYCLLSASMVAVAM